MCLLSPISVYTRQSSCNVNSTHRNQTGRSRTASPRVIAQQHSLLRRLTLLSFTQGKIRSEFKKCFFFSFISLLLNFKQRHFGSVYRLSYQGSIHILRHLTVRQLSLGYILPLLRAFIPNSQRRWFLGKRQLQEHNTTLLFKNIFNRNRVLSITHSPSGATTQIHTAIGSAVT